MKRTLHSLLLVSLTFPLSGCFLRQVLGPTYVTGSIANEVTAIVGAIFGNSTLTVCYADGADDGEPPYVPPLSVPGGARAASQTFNCTYVLNGEELATTSSLISEFGLFGVIVDPVVVEVPADLTNLSGTFRQTGTQTTRDLVVYPGLSRLPVDDTRTLQASPGKQLVVVDLPEGAPADNVTYDFDFRWRQTGTAPPAPFQIKAILTGKVDISGKVYYPPMLPCSADLASIPALTLAAAMSTTPIPIPRGMRPCAEEQYRYQRPPLRCDLDNDFDVDRGDLSLIMARRNSANSPGDPRDWTQNGSINTNDARACATQCTRGGCLP